MIEADSTPDYKNRKKKERKLAKLAKRQNQCHKEQHEKYTRQKKLENDHL